MSHLDSSALATYNSLVDPNLKCYFSNERIQSHLRHAGLISRRGEIISESEYRKRLVRRDHRRHVRQMLAENIVHRAIDMERVRQAEIRRQLDLVAKVTLVNNMKESQRRRRAHSSIHHETNREETHPLSIPSSWSQSRSKSPSEPIQPLRLNDEETTRIPRVHSAYVQSKAKKTFSKTSETNSRRSRTLSRPKSSIVDVARAAKMPLSSDLFSPQAPCEITMVYYGPNMKIDYDQTLFEPVDEVLVMQQHSGGENLIVYKGQLRAGEQFSFKSRRHANYPLGLSFYVKGLVDSRISTCCEYKHRHGVRLGGERGHFAILSVQGSKPCLKCRFEKQLKSKETTEPSEEKNKSISIAIPPSEQEQRRVTPIKIPVRHSSTTNENYSEDFDADSKGKRSGEKRSSIDSTLPKSPTTEEKLLSQRSSSNTNPRPKSPDETNSTSTIVSTEKATLKTWQITFHTTNTPTGSLQIPSKCLSKSFLNFSFLSKNREKRTEIYSIPLDDTSQCFQSGRQDSFPAKLTQIGQPEEIQLTLLVDSADDDDEEIDMTKIKWHLDFIELIDPETQHHWKFLCQKWIRPFEEHFLRLASPSARSSVSSRRQPSVSSTSSLKQKKIPSIPSTHRLSIFSANEEDGEFSPSDQTKLFVKINDTEREIPLINDDFSFRPGQMKSFDVTLPSQRIEQIHFGFVNSHITARCWKIEKIVLLNKETNEELTFVPRRPLMRNDFDFRAETLFLLQSDDDQRSTPRNVQMTSASLSSESEGNDRAAAAATTTNSRPKTRRGRDEPVRSASKASSIDRDGNDDEDDEAKAEEVWRASSSTDHRASSRTTKSTEENLFDNWYPKKSNGDDDDE